MVLKRVSVDLKPDKGRAIGPAWRINTSSQPTNRRPIMTIFTKTAIALMLASTAAFADPAGYKDLSIDAPHHNRPLTGALYYPSAGGGTPETYAENPVFIGVPVIKDAAIAQGKHPLVLLSHGMGGHVRSLGWLSTVLAERGAIVVAVNHPNSTYGDFDLGQGLQHWTRVQDLELALDTVLADPQMGALIDRDRIMAAGFSYGGWTALSLAGLHGNHAGYVAHCAHYSAASSHCDDLMRGDIDLQNADVARWNADYRDARITAAFSIEPGLIWGMTPADATGITADVTLVSLGIGESRLLATDFDLAGLPAVLPQAQIIRIVSGTHFSVLPLCKPQGEAILEDEKDDPVCTDPEGTDRAALHQQIIDAMSVKLKL
jgi:predicted dienelactone hydrolase